MSQKQARQQTAVPEDLFAKRLLFVTGKGGVGKTTTAAALGLAASRAGLRTIVCELAAQERIGTLFEGAGGVGFNETEVAPDLFAITIDPQHAIEEYLLLQIRIKPVYDLLFRNRVFEYFAAATPGMSELVTIGKIWELAQKDRLTKAASGYDLVIVDAPATGHGLAMLEAPGTFQRIARVGPIHRQAERIAGFLHDPSMTGIVAVTTAEEMPVNETIILRDSLRNRLELDLDLVVVNALEEKIFSDAEIKKLEKFDAPQVEAAVAQHQNASAQAEQLTRLHGKVKRPTITLPFLYERSFGRSALGELAGFLESELESPLKAVAP